MTERQSHAGEQHPEEWRRDLNPAPQAGQNRGGDRHSADTDARTAYEHKGANRRLAAFSDDELRDIPIVPTGDRLKQGAVYIDLRSHDCQEFKARGDQEAGPDNIYVAKNEVDYQLWNRLIGVDNPERTGAADDGEVSP
ncbi:MAG TPA: hypothetical protein PKD53_20060 [Chloroflexaceae bacterium]|nr:hypothetical protein [Chloroflexaceae bacterium]